MDIGTITLIRDRRPFVPFRLHLGGGRVVRVADPGCLAVVGAAKLRVVEPLGGSIARTSDIYCPSIVGIDFEG